MSERVIGLYDKFKSNSLVALFGFVILIDNVYSLTISYLITLYDKKLLYTGIDEFSLLEIFFLAVIIAPLIETFIFQFLIIEILSKFKVNTSLILWISTLLFSLSHNYNVVYILAMVFPGLLYASFYLFLKKETSKSPFFMIFLLHAIANLIAFIIDDVFAL
jgi:hypothetical protein